MATIVIKIPSSVKAETLKLGTKVKACTGTVFSLTAHTHTNHLLYQTIHTTDFHSQKTTQSYIGLQLMDIIHFQETNHSMQKHYQTGKS